VRQLDHEFDREAARRSLERLAPPFGTAACLTALSEAIIN
jgi:hypothetical protein